MAGFAAGLVFGLLVGLTVLGALSVTRPELGREPAPVVAEEAPPEGPAPEVEPAISSSRRPVEE
ncbi:hypothetical protein [Rubellimicrobium roseum]|uniref:Uncharacterized protein n=1 Tax=Rubellimicrobium roseum TaxID=687525 RepID=A0A5C4N747_9RHOB|nr:hypothetical protein [Rubellimicrobium roseum]TNC63224.1 hypothetical protein FHG71_19615 [Rubellimicrobium roseum]